MVARRLFNLRNQYSAMASDTKLSMLQRLEGETLCSAKDIRLLHTALCFIRAFPDTPKHYRLARAEMGRIESRVRALSAKERSKLADTGIIGTLVHYQFSFAVARWLYRRAPGTVSIDWHESSDPPGLDEILTHLLQPCDDEYFDSGLISAKEWIGLASAHNQGTDFGWLMAQLQEQRFAPIWERLYDAAELWLTWDLRSVRFSKTKNVLPVEQFAQRRNRMRKPVGSVKKEIMRPLESLMHLAPREGSRMIDVAMASLAVRHRETLHFNFANRREVYVANIGEGISIAIFGLQQQFRFPLECTMGYLIISNGVPIGYGGASALFRQANTGINIFDDYRGSEAAYLWVQVMRVYHHMVGCTRFIASAYQVGADNDDALRSGAFWFYYRLGYRPVLPDIARLARRELKRNRRNRTTRSDVKTLRRLASCDMHLTLAGARHSDLFDERWIEISSMLAAKLLAVQGGETRKAAADRIASKLASDLGVRSFDRWSASERKAFIGIAPFAALAKPKNWPAADKRAMRSLLRAKGGDCEAKYARLLARHAPFLSSLRKACRRAVADLNQC